MLGNAQEPFELKVKIYSVFIQIFLKGNVLGLSRTFFKLLSE